MTRPTARDFVDAFKRNHITPIQGSFNEIVRDGKYAARDNCGCAITAFMCGKEPSVLDENCVPLLGDFEAETGIQPWRFIGGFDGNGRNCDDSDLGREVLELLQAEGIEVLS